MIKNQKTTISKAVRINREKMRLKKIIDDNLNFIQIINNDKATNDTRGNDKLIQRAYR